MNDARSKTLITVDELVRLLGAQKPVVLLDVIDEQGAAPEDRPKIPSSLSVHLATDFSSKPTLASGRRPLPDMLELQSKVRAWGICSDSIVVVYDNSGGAQASRAWWTLRWAGLADVRVLDGGYGAWTATSRPSSNHIATRAVCGGDVILTTGCMPTVDAEEAAYLAKQSKLLDARPWAAYVGDPDKGGTGHIPGAIHAPSSDNIADGKFKPNKCRPRLEASKKICRACRRGVRMVAHRPVMRKVADNGQIVRCSTEATITPMSAFVCALRSVAVWPHLVAC